MLLAVLVSRYCSLGFKSPVLNSIRIIRRKIGSTVFKRTMFKSLKITPNRLIDTIHETAQWGAKGTWGPESTQTGVCRLSLSDLDKLVRDWFVAETKALGCEVKIDKLGNIFAIYPGKNEGLPTAVGSHLDTQPTGGRYDGVLGVLSGLELLRTMKDNDFVPNYPIAIINWTNEEGARFPMSLMSSQVWANIKPLEEIYALKSITDDHLVTVKDELKRIGYLGDLEVSYEANPIKCHFEIHIEQGPVLEDENKKIGVVIGGQAYNWSKVIVKGKSTHTGTTPLAKRSDALLAASKMITVGNQIAFKHNGLLSVGVLDLMPKVANVIPDHVEFIVDCRHVETEILYNIMDDYKQEFTKIANEGVAGDANELSVEFQNITTTEAIKFNETCIECVESCSVELFGKDQTRRIVSGAAHDSCATSTKVPTSMIFIPSKDGISHNPQEYSTPEQVAEGFQVLMNAVLKYDSLRGD